jgi:hypothetical protein
MPNWKKVITSGSDASLSSLNVSGSISASNIQIAEAIRHTGDSNTFISMSDDHMSFTAGNAKFIDYYEGYNGAGTDDRLIINPDKVSSLDFYVYGNNNNEAIIRTDAGTNKLWLRYHDDEGNSSNVIDRRTSTYYKGLNIRANTLIDESKFYIKDTIGTSDNDGGNIILQRIGDNNITSNEVLGGILFTGDDTDAPISGSTGFAIQARATGGWVSGSYPTKLVFYSGEKGHENWPDQGIFRIDPDGKTNIGTDDTPQEMLWVSGSIQSYVEGSFISASNLYGSINATNGVVSGSAQLEGFVSQSGNFVANETIIATGTNSVTSSNILALDTVNNYLGINQSNPEVTLHMTGDGAQTAQIRMEQYNDSSDAPDIRTRKARGTSASPAKNNAGDFIYRQNSERYNGSAYTTVGQFAVDANSSNADRFQLTLTVSEDGNTIDAAAAQFKIDGNDSGAITFNNSYKFPTSDGTNGQALITNGSGVLSFSNDYTGSFTGSFTGDGSGLTNVTSNITEEVTVSQTFTSATTASVNHLFGTKDVIVTVYDDNDDQFIPSRINTPDTNNVNIYMDPATTGRVVVAKGGHLVSGSIHKHLMTSVTSSTITHNLQEEFPVVQVYESASREMFIPETIKSIDQNNTQVVLSELIDCFVVIKR